MAYTQLTQEERYRISALKQQRYSKAAIARQLGRHRSTIGRELKRNKKPYDGAYRATEAHQRASGRRKRSKRRSYFSVMQWAVVRMMLQQDLSPEQVSGWLSENEWFSISHETIYNYVWRDKAAGGTLWSHLRGSKKLRRKRRNSYDSRGRLAGKRHISSRPQYIEARASAGHWEIDTVMDDTNSRCILTLVERATGFVMIHKLESKKMALAAKATIKLIRRFPNAFKTITADNGTEFHSYKLVEKATGTRYYFATPYHSWERGSNENTNGLIRQYLPKKTSFRNLSQRQCDRIAHKLNERPRKRLNYWSPRQAFELALRRNVALRS